MSELIGHLTHHDGLAIRLGALGDGLFGSRVYLVVQVVVLHEVAFGDGGVSVSVVGLVYLVVLMF